MVGAATAERRASSELEMPGWGSRRASTRYGGVVRPTWARAKTPGRGPGRIARRDRSGLIFSTAGVPSGQRHRNATDEAPSGRGAPSESPHWDVSRATRSGVSAHHAATWGPNRRTNRVVTLSTSTGGRFTRVSLPLARPLSTAFPPLLCTRADERIGPDHVRQRSARSTSGEQGRQTQQRIPRSAAADPASPCSRGSTSTLIWTNFVVTPRSHGPCPVHEVALILEADSQVGPVLGPPRQIVRGQRPSRAQGSVRQESDAGPGGPVGFDGLQIGHREAVLIALGPGSVDPAVGMDQPLAKGCDDGHAATRMSVWQPFCLREVEEPQVFRGHDRLLHHSAMLVGPGVGASSVILHRHGAVGMQRDHASSAAPARCLVSGISNDLKNKVSWPTRSELCGLLADLAEMVRVHGAVPVMRGVDPRSP